MCRTQVLPLVLKFLPTNGFCTIAKYSMEVEYLRLYSILRVAVACP